MEVQSRMSLPETANEEDRVTMNETSLIESHDSTSKCEGEPKPGPVDMEERSFVSSLYGFMKNKGTPIERIPHLGFKQINLWRIFKAVEKLGGYDLVTASRLWKNVYDELGGSPGSTSAATCTRRHYERLVLPFERHLRGEEDKPLPPSKPRKQYKRNNDGRVSKTEGKRKRTQSEREMDFEGEERPEAGSQSETRTHSLSTPWTITSDRAHPGSSQPNRGVDDLSPGLTYPHLLQVPALCPWGGPVSSAGEVISPLEKKKRMAQASLSLPLSPGHSEGKDRPSVIHCSQSPGMTPPRQNGNSSDGSPRPLSSSCSSRSPSPYSISSEDCAAPDQDKPASADLPPSGSSSFTHISGSCEGTKSLSSSPKTKDLVGPHKDIPHISPHRPDIDSEKRWSKDSVWIPVHKENGRYLAPQWPLSLAFTAKSDWMPASNSSFTKVVRPIPFQPTYRLNQRRSLQPDEALACEKKLHSMAPWLHPTEKKRCRTTLPKPLPTQQPLRHSTATLPPSYLLTGYDRSGRDSRHQPQPHPPFVTTRIRLPHEQPAYRHIPMGPTHSNFYGSAMYSYPYPVTLCNPQAGFSLTGMTSIYPQKH